MPLLHDTYSNLKYFQAFDADITGDAQADENGNTIDMRGFHAITVTMNAFSLASAGDMGAADIVFFLLQHGLASAAGVSTWSDVPESQLIHSVFGGLGSTAETGIFASIQSNAEVTAISGMYKVGYRQDADHRFLRVVVRNSDAASAMNLSGTAIAMPDTWPVNEPI